MGENTPDVSIVIASYNSAQWLPATIGSCLAQTPALREVVVIDDGSTDGTRAVCSGFGDRIRYERIGNSGVSAARNLGARLAVGEWLLFLDSDDILVPGALEMLLKSARSAKCGVAYGMVIQRAEPPATPKLNGFNYCEGEPPVPAQRNFRRSAIITPGSAIVKRALHGAVGGFVPGYEPMEDRDYWIKCGLLEPVRFCDSVVLDKTWRPGSAGSQDAKRIYRGAIAQQDLREWCAERGIDYSWAGTDADFACFALKEALYRKTDDILSATLELCRSSGYRGFWYAFALVRYRFLGANGKIPKTPAWISRGAQPPR
jgi:glycosyltransferase involved in cell wall biosynthesis